MLFSPNTGLMYKLPLRNAPKRPGSAGQRTRRTNADAGDSGTGTGKFAEVEEEMKRIGYWQNDPLRPEQYQFRMAFAMDTMAFSQWLQFIFIPRVKSMLETGEKFPRDSQNGAQAAREFDGDDNAQGLVTLLSEFDEIIRRGSSGWRRFFG